MVIVEQSISRPIAESLQVILGKYLLHVLTLPDTLLQVDQWIDQ